MNTTTIIQNTLWFSGFGFSSDSERFSSVVKVIPIRAVTGDSKRFSEAVQCSA